MKKEAQRVAIGEECGWKAPRECTRNPPHNWQSSNDGCCYDKLPDYLNDWNTRQEMLRVILHRGDLASFGAEILKTFGHPELLDKPAYFVWIGANCDQPQFCEAFLRVLGKWVEE